MTLWVHYLVPIAEGANISPRAGVLTGGRAIRSPVSWESEADLCANRLFGGGSGFDGLRDNKSGDDAGLLNVQNVLSGSAHAQRQLLCCATNAKVPIIPSAFQKRG